jgi:hypothetical protein
MSLDYILQQLDALGPLEPRVSITLDQRFLGSAEVITMFRAILDTDALTIDTVTESTSRAADHLELRGTATLLDITDAQVTFLAKEREGQLVVSLEIQLPSGWSFGTLFPRLETQKLAVKNPVDSDRIVMPHFLNQLSLGACRLVFASEAYFDERFGCDLVPGLNFVGELYPFAGPLRTLGLLVPNDAPVLLTGPIKEFRAAYDPLAFLGIRLSAPIGFGATELGPLSIRKSVVFMKACSDAYQRDPVLSATQKPGMYFLLDAVLGGRPLQMIGKLDDTNVSDELDIHGRFTDFESSGFSGLSQTVGVDGFGDHLPEEFPTPDGISITELGLSVDYADYSVAGMMLGLGTKVNWQIVPDVMSLNEIGISFFVRQPFDRNRSISTTLTGLLAFKKFSLAAYAEYPTFRIGAGLPAGETLPLGDVIESFLPGETDLPPLTITQLLLRASPKEKKFYLSTTLQDLLSIPVGATSFDVAGFAVLLDYDKAQGMKALVTAQLRLADANVVLSGEINNGLTLSGTLTNFELKKFWSLVTNGEALPDEVPDIIFETLSVRVSPKTGAFSLLGNATVAWDHLGGDGALSTNVQFSFTRQVTESAGSKMSSFSASLSLQGQGPVHIAEGFSLRAFNFLFDYRTGTGWQLSGGMGADVFDTSLDLQAGYETTQNVQKIKLRAMASPAKKLIDIKGVGSYSFQQFDCLLDRRAAADGKKSTFFDLRLASTLEIDHVFKIGGYLGVASTAEGKKSLSFKPNPGSAAFDIDFPTGEGMGIKAELFEVGIVKESAAAGWSFTGTTIIGFHDFPGALGKALPAKVNAKLVAGTTETRISALNVTSPIEIPLPTIDKKSLGKAVVQLTEVGITIAPQRGLVIEAGIGLPAELNTFLGAQIFRVYQPGNVTSLSRARFTISGTGVAMQFLGSPFAAANTVMVNGESWFDVDFGKYGAISLKMPTFVYDGVTQYFEAGGGVQIKRPLALPLAPLKMFLEACGGKAMADVFPDKLPLEGVMLVDKNGDLKIDELVAFLKKSGDVPGEVVSALKSTAKVLNRFPDGFKQYFNIEAPDHLEFKLGFSPAGRVTIGLLAPKKPVRVLFPSVVQSYVPMPGLCGIEVRKFSVGTLMAGALLYGEIDAIIDQYDLPSLAISLMLPRDEDFPLPTSDQLQRRIILDDVFCVIPVSAGLPIPIPLFYDEIGFEYMGVEGLGLQAHVGFPRPALDGAAAMEIFNAFKEFTSKPKALLDPKTPPGGVELSFVFHDEFLQAPEYLGGKLLGTKGKTVKVGLWKYIASMMNFGKTFSINDCIEAIPIENRVGSAEYKFAFMKFDADWMLTTPAEFRKGSFEKLKLSASDCADFMTVLPSVASSSGKNAKANEEGLVAFVRGKADLEFVKLEAAFGLAASSSMGFATGFKIGGGIGVVELELSGAIMVNSPLATGAVAAPVLKAALAAPEPKKYTPGRALSLNGKNAWIEIPASDSLVLREYTIELWIRSAKDQVGGWVEVFGSEGAQEVTQRNYYCEINPNDGYYNHRFSDAGGGNSGAPNTPNGSVAWGQWQHVVLTNDGDTAKTYIDGKEVASGPVKDDLAVYKQVITIGKAPTRNGKFWKGEIAEVRLWKRARSAGAIAAQMRQVLDGDERDLVSLYRFDEDRGGRALDVCGRNHGTITNGAFVNSDLLMLQGLDFDGEDDWIEIADSQSLRIGAYTVEAWIKPYKSPDDLAAEAVADAIAKVGSLFSGSKKKPAKGPEWQCVFGKKGRNYSIFLNKQGFVHHRFHTPTNTNDGPPNTPNGSIAWNRWNHVAITNDGKTARTYVNGAKLAEGAVQGGLVIDNEKISIAKNADGTNNERFAGEIAEIRLWNRERSAEELSTNMSRRLDGKDASLVSLWRPGESSGATLVDACGKNPGRIYMNDAVEPEKLQHDGLVFSGKGDYALIDKSDKWKTGQYTIEAWVRPDKNPTGSWQCIWGGGGKAPKIYLNGNGLVSHRYSAIVETMVPGLPPKVTKNEKQIVLNTEAGVVRFGEWNHIAVANNGKTCTVLVNGAVKAQNKIMGELVPDAAAINVGRSDDGKDAAFFRGSIDDIRYWSIARAEEQIAATMHLPITGSEAGLVAYYNMDHTAGTQLVDLGPNKLSGTVNGAEWALAAAPADPAKVALQIFGHTHLAVAGHKVMKADLRLVGGQFWFAGELDLFPKDWPIRVYGRVEGMVSKKRFYLSGETENKLFGLTLSKSRLFLSNDEIRLEGRWLGAFMMLDISWDKNDPIFKGSVGFGGKHDIQFGAIHIGGVKVANNVHLSLDIGADVSVVVSKKGFSADVTARFTINGKGFDLRFGVDVAPSDLASLWNWIKQKIIDAPAKFLAHMFGDAATWLKNVGEGAIEFAKDVGEAVGKALNTAFKVSKEAAATLMKGAGYAAKDVGKALSGGYKIAANEATAALKGAGYAAEEVGDALQSAYKTSSQEATKLLKGAGYAAKDVGKALSSAYGASSDECEKLMKGAGYAANEVKDTLEDFGKGVGKGAKKELNKLGKSLGF